MKKTTILTLIFAFASSLVFSQIQVEPVLGKYKNSFVLSWKRITNVEKYEFVFTDNPNCYAGCSGDTKTDQIGDTSTLVFPGFENKNYYWKFRPIIENSDSVIYWSDVQTFVTDYPKEELATDIAFLFPNPSTDNEINLKVDWSLLNNENSINYTIHDLNGNVVLTSDALIKRENKNTRFYIYTINVQQLVSGTYILNLDSYVLGRVEQIRFNIK